MGDALKDVWNVGRHSVIKKGTSVAPACHNTPDEASSIISVPRVVKCDN